MSDCDFVRVRNAVQTWIDGFPSFGDSEKCLSHFGSCLFGGDVESCRDRACQHVAVPLRPPVGELVVCVLP